MADSGLGGFSRVVKATQYSWRGLRAAYQHEEAFRQELWLSLILIPMGFWLGQTGMEKALLISSVMLLPLVELLNSAIEAVVDRIGDEHHELAGRAKDMASAAVAIAIALMVVVWGLILLG
ncbi:MAG: diacylglycerol kinase [Gammaproteobacteria bacterium]|nr:diacylglycerol kinase [Gammaproteobacteria bacterium]